MTFFKKEFLAGVVLEKCFGTDYTITRFNVNVRIFLDEVPLSRQSFFFI